MESIAKKIEKLAQKSKIGTTIVDYITSNLEEDNESEYYVKEKYETYFILYVHIVEYCFLEYLQRLAKISS